MSSIAVPVTLEDGAEREQRLLQIPGAHFAVETTRGQCNLTLWGCRLPAAQAQLTVADTLPHCFPDTDLGSLHFLVTSAAKQVPLYVSNSKPGRTTDCSRVEPCIQLPDKITVMMQV